MGRATLSLRFFFVCCFGLSVSSLGASVIILKNGDIISGKLQEVSTANYLLHSKFGTLDIQKSNIEKIIWNEKSLKQVEITVKKEKTTGRLIRKTNKGSAFLLGDGSVIYKKKPKPVLAKKFFAGNLFIRPTFGVKKLPQFHFNSQDDPAMRYKAGLTPGIDIGFMQSIHNLLQLHITGGYAASKRSFVSETDNRQLSSVTSTNRWSIGLGLRFYPLRFGGSSSVWQGLYTTFHTGYQLTDGEISVESIEPYYFMDSRTVTGEAGSLYGGLSLGFELPITDRLALDFNFRWQRDFYQTLFDDATRRSVTGKERELTITGNGPLATQLRAAAAQESINKNKVTNAFQSEIGNVHTWLFGLGVSYRFLNK